MTSNIPKPSWHKPHPPKSFWQKFLTSLFGGLGFFSVAPIPGLHAFIPRPLSYFVRVTEKKTAEKTEEPVEPSQGKTKESVKNEVARQINIWHEAADMGESFVSYKVQAGDSLWKIAEAKLGDGMRWIDIWTANQFAIKEPNLIFTGQELKIPKFVLSRTALFKSPAPIAKESKITPAGEMIKRQIISATDSIGNLNVNAATQNEARQLADQAGTISDFNSQAVDLTVRTLDLGREAIGLTQTATMAWSQDANGNIRYYTMQNGTWAPSEVNPIGNIGAIYGTQDITQTPEYKSGKIIQIAPQPAPAAPAQDATQAPYGGAVLNIEQQKIYNKLQSTAGVAAEQYKQTILSQSPIAVAAAVAAAQADNTNLGTTVGNAISASTEETSPAETTSISLGENAARQTEAQAAAEAAPGTPEAMGFSPSIHTAETETARQNANAALNDAVAMANQLGVRTGDIEGTLRGIMEQGVTLNPDVSYMGKFAASLPGPETVSLKGPEAIAGIVEAATFTVEQASAIRDAAKGMLAGYDPATLSTSAQRQAEALSRQMGSMKAVADWANYTAELNGFIGLKAAELLGEKISPTLQQNMNQAAFKAYGAPMRFSSIEDIEKNIEKDIEDEDIENASAIAAATLTQTAVASLSIAQGAEAARARGEEAMAEEGQMQTAITAALGRQAEAQAAAQSAQQATATQAAAAAQVAAEQAAKSLAAAQAAAAAAGISIDISHIDRDVVGVDLAARDKQGQFANLGALNAAQQAAKDAAVAAEAQAVAQAAQQAQAAAAEAAAARARGEEAMAEESRMQTEIAEAQAQQAEAAQVAEAQQQAANREAEARTEAQAAEAAAAAASRASVEAAEREAEAARDAETKRSEAQRPGETLIEGPPEVSPDEISEEGKTAAEAAARAEAAEAAARGVGFGIGEEAASGMTGPGEPQGGFGPGGAETGADTGTTDGGGGGGGDGGGGGGGDGGGGGCFKAGTYVATAIQNDNQFTYEKIENLKIGDTIVGIIFDKSGKPSIKNSAVKKLFIHEPEEYPFWELETQRGVKIIATGNHGVINDLLNNVIPMEKLEISNSVISAFSQPEWDKVLKTKFVGKESVYVFNVKNVDTANYLVSQDGKGWILVHNDAK